MVASSIESIYHRGIRGCCLLFAEAAIHIWQVKHEICTCEAACESKEVSPERCIRVDTAGELQQVAGSGSQVTDLHTYTLSGQIE